ncbi:hypothetical protein N9M66_00410 [Litoreibacter sp.]|nr:hypothetical protein [Litoreibacter sp.]
MTNQLDRRLKHLEALAPSNGSVDLILHVIVAPSPDGPRETGRYLADVVGRTGRTLENKSEETKDDFVARLQDQFAELGSAA